MAIAVTERAGGAAIGAIRIHAYDIAMSSSIAGIRIADALLLLSHW